MQPRKALAGPCPSASSAGSAGKGPGPSSFMNAHLAGSSGIGNPTLRGRNLVNGNSVIGNLKYRFRGLLSVNSGTIEPMNSSTHQLGNINLGTAANADTVGISAHIDSSTPEDDEDGGIQSFTSQGIVPSSSGSLFGPPFNLVPFRKTHNNVRSDKSNPPENGFPNCSSIVPTNSVPNLLQNLRPPSCPGLGPLRSYCNSNNSSMPNRILANPRSSASDGRPGRHPGRRSHAGLSPSDDAIISDSTPGDHSYRSSSNTSQSVRLPTRNIVRHRDTPSCVPPILNFQQLHNRNGIELTYDNQNGIELMYDIRNGIKLMSDENVPPSHGKSLNLSISNDSSDASANHPVGQSPEGQSPEERMEGSIPAGSPTERGSQSNGSLIGSNLVTPSPIATYQQASVEHASPDHGPRVLVHQRHERGNPDAHPPHLQGQSVGQSQVAVAQSSQSYVPPVQQQQFRMGEVAPLKSVAPHVQRQLSSRQVHQPPIGPQRGQFQHRPQTPIPSHAQGRQQGRQQAAGGNRYDARQMQASRPDQGQPQVQSQVQPLVPPQAQPQVPPQAQLQGGQKVLPHEQPQAVPHSHNLPTGLSQSPQDVPASRTAVRHRLEPQSPSPPVPASRPESPREDYRRDRIVPERVVRRDRWDNPQNGQMSSNPRALDHVPITRLSRHSDRTGITVQNPIEITGQNPTGDGGVSANSEQAIPQQNSIHAGGHPQNRQVDAVDVVRDIRDNTQQNPQNHQHRHNRQNQQNEVAEPYRHLIPDQNGAIREQSQIDNKRLQNRNTRPQNEMAGNNGQQTQTAASVGGAGDQSQEIPSTQESCADASDSVPYGTDTPADNSETVRLHQGSITRGIRGNAVLLDHNPQRSPETATLVENPDLRPDFEFQKQQRISLAQSFQHQQVKDIQHRLDSQMRSTHQHPDSQIESSHQHPDSQNESSHQHSASQIESSHQNPGVQTVGNLQELITALHAQVETLEAEKRHLEELVRRTMSDSRAQDHYEAAHRLSEAQKLDAKSRKIRNLNNQLRDRQTKLARVQGKMENKITQFKEQLVKKVKSFIDQEMTQFLHTTSPLVSPNASVSSNDPSVSSHHSPQRPPPAVVLGLKQLEGMQSNSSLVRGDSTGSNDDSEQHQSFVSNNFSNNPGGSRAAAVQSYIAQATHFSPPQEERTFSLPSSNPLGGDDFGKMQVLLDGGIQQLQVDGGIQQIRDYPQQMHSFENPKQMSSTGPQIFAMHSSNNSSPADPVLNNSGAVEGQHFAHGNSFVHTASVVSIGHQYDHLDAMNTLDSRERHPESLSSYPYNVTPFSDQNNHPNALDEMHVADWNVDSVVGDGNVDSGARNVRNLGQNIVFNQNMNAFGGNVRSGKAADGNSPFRPTSGANEDDSNSGPFDAPAGCFETASRMLTGHPVVSSPEDPASSVVLFNHPRPDSSKLQIQTQGPRCNSSNIQSQAQGAGISTYPSGNPTSIIQQHRDGFLQVGEPSSFRNAVDLRVSEPSSSSNVQNVRPMVSSSYADAMVFSSYAEGMDGGDGSPPGASEEGQNGTGDPLNRTNLHNNE